MVALESIRLQINYSS